MSNAIYLIEDATDRIGDSALLQRWRELLAESDSHGRVYQSPEFFDYLLSTATEHAPPQLFTVTERASGTVVGVVPLALRRHSFDFIAGRLHLGSLPVPSVCLLGSAPLMPARAELLDLLFKFLLAKFPLCQAISLGALPAHSELWHNIRKGSGYTAHLLNNWRTCHQIPLPASFEAFMAQFNSKRRYNLKRQQRQLRDHGGGRLALQRIEQPEQLPSMLEAMSRLTTPEHRAQLWTQEEMRELALHGMLLCYQIDCGGQPCALILGLRSSDTLHLFNIFHDKALDHLSVGTTILHMAIEDLCSRGFTCIDLGYGTPAHSYQSSNATVQRGHVLLMRSNTRNRLARALHGAFVTATKTTRRFIK
ncbi:GNAT family N-acetyltransferase [Duganella sp. BJB488]|uniref:GNAT family N-acetyltransferase n=1 Tax=unclassified Duganella TaxID=2636909 RepID=UPI000E3480AC|nr:MULTISPECIES: GNAT family N-acetyltransferase [unclassified Duganella]RFP17931.1 GNAT family N-acetyltransferase [Duganella sp. BJB489]RFP22389.1 GNAT family N-acetyltransferase [Duganella sp. BJB488]RFP37986.1 GNAT family N-acetyltransferase [Duganella sp. BJB480]